MPAQHQDVWYRPMADLPITEPRWAKMVEIRPRSLKARKTIHHSIAYLVLNNDPEAVNTGTASGPDRFRNDDDIVNRRPQLMEWAIGKGYDLFRPGTGKLLLPGEKIAWDQHIHAVGEEIASGSEIGIWLYKKGEEPKKRSYLIGFTGIDRSKMLELPPNSMAMTEGFTVPEGERADRKLPAALPPARQVDAGRSDSADGSKQMISYVGNFNFNWMTNYIYGRRRGAAPAEGNRRPRHRVVRQHQGEQEQSRSGSMVGYGDRTVDEMAHAWMNVVYFNDAEYNSLVEERKAKTVKATNDEKQQ